MLSKKAQYAIYALVKLAREYNKGPVLISEIAASERIPKKFLETILSELKNIGIVRSKMGKGGGYFLYKEPDSVNLAEIVRHFDGAIALLPCVTFKFYEECKHCKDETTCGVRSYIKDIRDKAVEIMKEATLSEIINRENALFQSKSQ